MERGAATVNPVCRRSYPCRRSLCGHLAAEGRACSRGFASDCRGFLDGEDRGGGESQPGRERGCRLGNRRGAVCIHNRNPSRAVCVSPEALEFETVWWSPLREEGEIPLDGLLAVVEEVPCHVEQPAAPVLSEPDPGSSDQRQTSHTDPANRAERRHRGGVDCYVAAERRADARHAGRLFLRVD